ncbi:MULTISPECIES: hypothetical protein [Clostridium]|uniref:hypothetical protein n=1 Tax=Clostridium TaxID=1485 RepID=UPI0008264D1A|nr:MULTISPECIES: hypothetical protein [Clostridium]PJI07276.1 hypothetical protein CUB90_05090 [Clostridium sp. CT7]
MDTKNKIFSASFQQSLAYVNNPKQLASMEKEFIKNYFHEHSVIRVLFCSFLSLLLFGVLPYILGAFLPQELAKAQIGSINDINYYSAVMAGKIGSYLIAVPQVFELFWVITWIYFPLRRMLPGYSMKNAMKIAILQMVLLTNILFFTGFPMLVGFAISGSGILGMVVQVLFVIYFLIKSIIHTRNRILFELYKTKVEMKKGGSLKKFFNIFVVFVLLIINSYFPRIGMITPVDSYQILYGWLFLIISIVSIFLGRIVTPTLLAHYYIIKYSESYREIWEITDEQWYGKRRAKRIARRKKIREKINARMRSR